MRFCFGAFSSNFNPRFPRGKRRFHAPGFFHTTVISIHASRGGSDTSDNLAHNRDTVFQSTLPAGEATAAETQNQRPTNISIHASRGGSDPAREDNALHPRDFNPRFPRGKRPFCRAFKKAPFPHFNPRFPRGKRRCGPTSVTCLLNFNPRFPRGKRPIKFGSRFLYRPISIHASRGGSDHCEIAQEGGNQIFQSTLPAGEATTFP